MTNCYYCTLFAGATGDGVIHAAEFDLGSSAPRCAAHWRVVCGCCDHPAHFMAAAFCTVDQRYFCAECAQEVEMVSESFFGWEYYYRYRSPWSGRWEPALDRAMFEGRHPYQAAVSAGREFPGLSTERQVDRANARSQSWLGAVDDMYVTRSWEDNAERWDEVFDAEGDESRKYHGDAPLLTLLGDVRDARVLDLGCGNGYLSRILAGSGAHVVGVDPSEKMVALAREREIREPLGVAFEVASADDLSEFADARFDIIVANHVLTAIMDLGDALVEANRVLLPGGRLVALFSHPCFSCGPRTWISPVPDSPRPEENTGYVVDHYFRTGTYAIEGWEGFSPVPYIHRPLKEYWQAFRGAGFAVDDFDEPVVTERGLAELPQWRVAQLERAAQSCIFACTKVGNEVRLGGSQGGL
ncbi:Ubiquinone biosynthesis O-methyltransferase [Nocardia gamkensis]|nr:Ubiquinone biosynthesis O-methyltransferase [Nocardia gamkensis]